MIRSALIVLSLIAGVLFFTSNVPAQDDVPPDYPIRQNEKLSELYDALTDLTNDKRASLKTFAQNVDAIRAYDPETNDNFDSAKDALVAVYGVQGEKSNLQNVHWLLQVKAIDNEVSEKGAAIRNQMVKLICEEMARNHGEVHRMDFSPAVNMLNDIDQTFKAVARLRALGLDGQKIANEFDELFKEKFKIPASHLDVISHPFEARPPDWRQKNVKVYDFVCALRKGSGLLAANPEAYFLEGAFRMQVDRRSYESDKELYTIYAAHPEDGDSAPARLVVQGDSDTIRKLSYKFVPPEVRRSYAWGSSVGNFWFYKEHGFGTRYAAKYGLRSFAEGPGWLVMFDQMAAQSRDEVPTFDSYEDMVDASARTEVAKLAFEKHFGDINLGSADTEAEFLWTLNKAREIRAMKDNFNSEAAFESDALKSVGGDVAEYESNKSLLLKAADRRFRRNMTRIMVRNIEISLPARVADWIAPKVDPRFLRFTDEEIKNEPEKVAAEVKAAEKRLRVAALVEVVHGLKVLFPGQRKRVIARAKEAVAKIARERGLKQDMTKALDAVLRIAEKENPTLLQSDEQAGRKRTNVGTKENPVLIATDDPLETAVAKQKQYDQETLAQILELETALKTLQSALDDGSETKYQSSWAQKTFGLIQSSLTSRWDRATKDFNDSVTALQEGIKATPKNVRVGWQTMKDPTRRAVAIQQARENAWSNLGYEASKLDNDPLKVQWQFRRDVFVKNAVRKGVTWQNADATIKLIQAYRQSDGNWEMVRSVAIAEMANRLPVVGELIDIRAILSGQTHPGMFAVKGVGLLYPGFGQVVVVYGVTKGAFDLVMDVLLDRDTASLLQGTIPNAGSTAPASLPISHPGFLRPVYRAMLAYRDELMQRRDRSTDKDEIELINEYLDHFTPDIKGTHAFVYKFFDRELDDLLQRKGLPADRWPIVKLSSNLGVIRSIEPEDIYNPANLPPLLRAYFRKTVRHYLNGTGEYANLPAHRQAHADKFLRERYFFADAEKQRNQVEESLTSVLAAAFVNSLVGREKGESTVLRVDGQWDKFVDSPIGPTAYIDGRTRQQVTIASPADDDDALPGLPSILDVVPGDTIAAKRRAFLQYFDDILNKKLVGRVQPEQRLQYKLGAHHADLRPIAAEEAAVAHPLLTSFFSSRVMKYQADHKVEPVAAPDVDVKFAAGILGGVGEAAKDPSARIADINKKNEIDLRRRAASSLIKLYRKGMLWSANDKHKQLERSLEDLRMPHAFAMSKISSLMFGDETDRIALPPEVARTLGMVSGDPRVFDKDAGDDVVPELLQLLEKHHADKGATIEITGIPGGPIAPDKLVRIQARTAASDHYRRPLAVKWQMGREGSDVSKTQPITKGVGNLYLTSLVVPENSSTEKGAWTLRAVLVDADGNQIASTEKRLELQLQETPKGDENVKMMVSIAKKDPAGAASRRRLFGSSSPQQDANTQWATPNKDNCRAGSDNKVYLWVRWADLPEETTSTKITYVLRGGIPHIENPVTDRVIKGYDKFTGAKLAGNAFVHAPFSNLRGRRGGSEVGKFNITGTIQAFGRSREKIGELPFDLDFEIHPGEYELKGTASMTSKGRVSTSVKVGGCQNGSRIFKIDVGGVEKHVMSSGSFSCILPGATTIPQQAKLTFWDYGAERTINVPLKSSSMPKQSEPYESSVKNALMEIEGLKARDASRYVFDIADKYHGLGNAYEGYAAPEHYKNWRKYRELSLEAWENGMREMENPAWKNWAKKDWRTRDGKTVYGKNVTADVRRFHIHHRTSILVERFTEACQYAAEYDDLEFAKELLTQANAAAADLMNDSTVGALIARDLAAANRSLARSVFRVSGKFDEANMYWNKEQSLRQKYSEMKGQRFTPAKSPYQSDPSFQMTHQSENSE